MGVKRGAQTGVELLPPPFSFIPLLPSPGSLGAGEGHTQFCSSPLLCPVDSEGCFCIENVPRAQLPVPMGAPLIFSLWDAPQFHPPISLFFPSCCYNLASPFCIHNNPSPPHQKRTLLPKAAAAGCKGVRTPVPLAQGMANPGSGDIMALDTKASFQPRSSDLWSFATWCLLLCL